MLAPALPGYSGGLGNNVEFRKFVPGVTKNAASHLVGGSGSGQITAVKNRNRN